jgi:hypothetical protein
MYVLQMLPKQSHQLTLERDKGIIYAGVAEVKKPSSALAITSPTKVRLSLKKHCTTVIPVRAIKTTFRRPMISLSHALGRMKMMTVNDIAASMIPDL